MEKSGTLGYYAGSHWFMGAVAAGLIGLFSLWLLSALLAAEAAAEKAVVEITVRNMRLGLKMAMGEAMIAGRQGEIAGWAGSNPVRWLDGVPVGYLGDCPAAGAGALPEAAWCFDTVRRQLLYRPRHGRHLQLLGEPVGKAEKILRWQVALPAGTATNGEFVGVSVQLLTPYLWLME